VDTCYAIENWSLFVALVVILKTIEFDQVGSGISVRTVVGVVTNFSTLKACDVSHIILIGLGNIGLVITPVISLTGLIVALLASP
jgi:ABC-type xylose transport system permease subunit